MVLVIDNYDSFTYNLVQYLGELGATVIVRRNDEASIDRLRALNHTRVVISPGPGRPEHAGVTLDVIKEFGPRMPLWVPAIQIAIAAMLTGIALMWVRRHRRRAARTNARGGT